VILESPCSLATNEPYSCARGQNGSANRQFAVSRKTGSYPEMSFLGNQSGGSCLPHNACQLKENNTSGGRPEPPLGQNDCENRVSKNSPSFAVALNCGMGSNSLNAEVNAFDRLQIVRGRNSS